MEKIELKNIKLSDNRIEYEYFISDGLLKYFKNPLNKYIMEYKLNGEKYCLDNIPESVLSIPFVCNMLPLIWLTDSKLCVKCLDKDFYNCITDLKNGYIEMYPKAIFAGYVEIIDVETNINQKERLEKLNRTAKKQLEVLINDKNIIGIEKYDNGQKLIGNKK